MSFLRRFYQVTSVIVQQAQQILENTEKIKLQKTSRKTNEKNTSKKHKRKKKIKTLQKTQNQIKSKKKQAKKHTMDKNSNNTDTKLNRWDNKPRINRQQNWEA